MENIQKMEEWKDIEGFENLYQISNQGNVKSLERFNCKSKRLYDERILKPTIRNGYLGVLLYKNGKGKNHSIHRLVASAFCQRKENCNIVDHIDGNRTNNHSSNLRWVTCEENLWNPNTHYKSCGKNNGFYGKKHTDETKRKMKERHYDANGANNPSARAVVNLNTGEIFETAKQASISMGLTTNCVGASIHRKSKSGGYYWAYLNEWDGKLLQ